MKGILKQGNNFASEFYKPGDQIRQRPNGGRTFRNSSEVVAMSMQAKVSCARRRRYRRFRDCPRWSRIAQAH